MDLVACNERLIMWMEKNGMWPETKRCANAQKEKKMKKKSLGAPKTIRACIEKQPTRKKLLMEVGAQAIVY